jgi:hypothetical protein
MKNFLKKQTISTYLAFASFVFAFVGFIVYLSNMAAEGYFKGPVNPLIVLFSLIALIALIGVLVLTQFAFQGFVKKILDFVLDALAIVAPVLLLAGMMYFISDRAQGLAYIYGSDANVLTEIQTPANLASATTAIVGFIFYGIAALVGIVASFFRLPKDKTEEDATQKAA